MKIVAGLSRLKGAIIDWVNMILCIYENVRKLPTLCNNKIINKTPIRNLLENIYVSIYIYVDKTWLLTFVLRGTVLSRERA